MNENQKIKILDNLRTSLAKYSHDSWSGWMQYLFEKSRKNKGGSITIPKDLVERWKRQMNTDFFDLSENERESDYKEANNIMSIIRLIINNE